MVLVHVGRGTSLGHASLKNIYYDYNPKWSPRSQKAPPGAVRGAERGNRLQPLTFPAGKGSQSGPQGPFSFVLPPPVCSLPSPATGEGGTEIFVLSGRRPCVALPPPPSASPGAAADGRGGGWARPPPPLRPPPRGGGRTGSSRARGGALSAPGPLPARPLPTSPAPAPPPRSRPARRQPDPRCLEERGGAGGDTKGGAAGPGPGGCATWTPSTLPLSPRSAASSSTCADGCGRRTASSRRTSRPSRMTATTGPKVIQTSAANFSLNNSKKLKPIQILSNPLSTYNQQLWLTCVVELDQSKETSIKTSFPMTVKVDGVAQDGTTMYIHNKVHNRTRTLTCAGKCAEIIVAHLGYLNYTQYTVIVGFEHLKLPIKGMNFTWKTYNPAFSQLEIWFRFFFVVLTFIVTCLFAHSLRKFSMRDWGIEQKWMSVLLPLLLLYNDPFFPLSFLVNSWLPGMLDDLFQSMFLCALLLFWLCVYHGIRVQGERKCLTFYLPKFFIVGLLWLASVTLGIWQTVNELHDPMYQYRVDTGNFQGMKVFFMVVAAVYVLYLLFLIVRACSELRHMPYVDLRLKFLTALTFVVLVISIVILYLRFGAQVLQDNFVAELSTHYQNYILLTGGPWLQEACLALQRLVAQICPFEEETSQLPTPCSPEASSLLRGISVGPAAAQGQGSLSFLCTQEA
uniref:Transmembrane protein 181 n=2 Tax=Cercopithecinae TaxID=9528 RepID=F6QZT7_MACMU